MTLTHDIPCSGGCGKVRSVVTTEDAGKQWLCFDCRNTRKVGRTRKARARKASELQRLYLIERKRGFIAKHAYNAAKTRMDWARVEYPSEGEPTFGIAPKLGNVRLSIKPDEIADLEDLFGDTYNPEVNDDIPASRLEREKQAEIDRVNRDGVWGVIGEYFDGEEWQVTDSCWGFVGDDWKSSGYDTDIMRTTLDAARKVAVCECCGRPKRKAVA